ncbi:MAG: MmgE/PrpD family protein [Alphaproteobacteria bacterium]|nr:MmgE/PrpD family protein [Alphaproteobacteria bacterium]
MIAGKFAAFAVSLRDGDLPEAAAHGARRCLVDWFAAAVPGADEPPAPMLARALASEGTGRALLVPGGVACGVRAAALINGAAAHVLEFDDIYREAIYHPGAPVIAAALAVAQDRGLGGDAFLRAVIAGYEVSTRIGEAMLPSHYEFWHTTGTAGTIGAAAAAGVLCGLDAKGMTHALANAVTFAAGLQQAFRADSMSKPLHAGHAAETGVTCALAAEAGVTGAADVIEGPAGFAAAMSREAIDWDAVADSCGAHWNMARMTHKNHSCCGHTFAAVDAVLALRAAHGLAPVDVAALRVGTYGFALEVAGNPDPKTAFEARFSLQYVCAAALATGRVRMEAFTPERLADAEIRALLDRVSISVDAAADAAAPGRRSAAVEIDTTDGRKLAFRAETRKGDPENPLTDAELEDKYFELTEPVLGRATADALLAELWGIERVADLTRLALFPARA